MRSVETYHGREVGTTQLTSPPESVRPPTTSRPIVDPMRTHEPAPPRDPATIVLADDSRDVRAIARRHLERHDRFDVVGEAADGRDAVAVVAELQPDVVLLDLRMPRMDGLEALPQILTRSPGTMVAALSAMESDLMADAARARGAFAYIEKNELDADLGERLWRLLQEFRRALAGDTVVAPHRP